MLMGLLRRICTLCLYPILSVALAQTQPAPTSADLQRLSGAGLAQHPFLYCGEWQGRGKTDQIMYIVRGGKIVSTYAIPGHEEYSDCTKLWPETVQVIEITPQKRSFGNCGIGTILGQLQRFNFSMS
jgi:hypothetical protein